MYATNNLHDEVSDWLLFYSAISWREQVAFDKVMIMSALYSTTAISWILVLTHWNNVLRVDNNTIDAVPIHDEN